MSIKLPRVEKVYPKLRAEPTRFAGLVAFLNLFVRYDIARRSQRTPLAH
jgi:hypothetical protein